MLYYIKYIPLAGIHYSLPYCWNELERGVERSLVLGLTAYLAGTN